MRLPLVYVFSDVRGARLRDVRSDMLFSPYGHHVPSWERIQGYFSPTHERICSVYMCIFNPLDHRGEQFFGYTWKRTSWRARRCTGCPWGRHGLLVSNVASIFCARKKKKKKKKLNNKYLCDKLPPFSDFKNLPRRHACLRAKPLHVSKRINVLTRLIDTWAFRIWPPIDQKLIFGHFISIFLARPILNA
jgi:hypothetical protein